jgi:hypothetical protein
MRARNKTWLLTIQFGSFDFYRPPLRYRRALLAQALRYLRCVLTRIFVLKKIATEKVSAMILIDSGDTEEIYKRVGDLV